MHLSHFSASLCKTLEVTVSVGYINTNDRPFHGQNLLSQIRERILPYSIQLCFVRNPDDSALVADVFLDLNKLMNLNRKNGIFFYELDCSKKCQAISSL